MIIDVLLGILCMHLAVGVPLGILACWNPVVNPEGVLEHLLIPFFIIVTVVIFWPFLLEETLEE